MLLSHIVKTALIVAIISLASPSFAVVGASGNGNSAAVCTVSPPQTCVVITGTGAQKVDGSAVVQPVSGTLTVNTPPPDATPIPYATSAGTIIKVDGSSVTQPVSGSFPTPLAIQPVSGTITVNTPAPFSGIVTQGTSPWIVNTPPPAATPVPYATSAGTVLKTDNSAVTQPVSGTFFQATQPVSGSVSVSNFPATQPISGTVTANQGGTWTVQPGNTANTTAWKVDGSAVTQPVSGTITANAGSGNFTVIQPTGTNLHAVLDAGSAIIGKAGIDQTTPGTTNLVNSKICDKTTPTQCVSVSAGGLVSTGSFISSGNTSQSVACDHSTAINIVAASTVSLVPVSGATIVYVCSYDVEVVTGAGTTWALEYGTGAACTSPTALTGVYADGVGTHTTAGSGEGTLMRSAASAGLCIVTVGGGQSVQGRITWTQF